MMKSISVKLLCLVISLVTLLSVCLLPMQAAEEKPTFAMNPKSPLKGIKVGFYGDSICAANIDSQDSFYANLQGWAGRIGVTNYMLWENHGISGYSVSNCRGNRTIMTQLQGSIDKDYDMMILHGGTNDAWDNAPVGIMSKEFKSSDQYDPSTFAGALEQIFAFIREKNPDAIVGYVINFKFVNAKNGVQVGSDYRLNAMGDYVNMIINICEKWEIPYLDLYHNDELTDALHVTKKDAQGNVTYQNTYLYDYVHPSSLGYNMLYPYIEDFMIDLVTPKAEETTTAAATDAATTTDSSADGTEVEADASTTVTDAEVKPGGCGASLTAFSVALPTLIGITAVTARKRKETRKQ